jgi:hypothetical protein
VAGWAIFSPSCLPSIGNLVLVGGTEMGQDRELRSPKIGVLVAISLCCHDREAAVGVGPARTWRLRCAACQSGERA